MSLNISWLSNIFRVESDKEKIERLALEASELERKAVYVEEIAKLQKRITNAKKRIKVASPGSGGFSIGNLRKGTGAKIIAVLVIVIVVIIIIAKIR